MRELRTVEAVLGSGVTRSRIAWAIKKGRWTHITRGVLGRGHEPPSRLDVARAKALITDGVAVGTLSAVLRQFDGVELGSPEILVSRKTSARREGITRRTRVAAGGRVVGQVKCEAADATLLRLARQLDDQTWEQALEFCFRKTLVTDSQVTAWSCGSTVAARRVRRVVKVRGGLEVPHTDSLLETLAVQLMRDDPRLPTPTRQLPILDPETGRVVARVDLCWPALRLFLELDGQQHNDQPVYDARRQNLVTAITGWRCARLTWDQVDRQQPETLNELAQLLLGCSLS